MKTKHLVFAAITVFALSRSANAQNIIGVGAPTGTTRNDTYIAAGFEFYSPAGAGTTINALGFWDQNGTGLLAVHTVSIFKYHPGILSGSGYDLLATATIPAGTAAPLINGYRWVGIPTLTLPDNGQGGGYYAILANQTQDTWTSGISTPPYLNPSIGTVSGQGLISSGNSYTVLSSQALLSGDGNPAHGFGGANLAFLTPKPPTQPAAAPILWIAQGAFTDDTVLNMVGAVSNEVYGVDFGGSGLQTTANGYTFNDYATTGNMTLAGNLSSYNAYLSGGGTTGDGAFDSVLNYGIYGNSDITAILNNLSIGQRYNVLVVAADTRGSSGINFGVTDDLSRSPLQTLSFPGGTPAVGGYIEGTFTATATSQILTIFGQVQYNGVLLLKVPPASIILATNTQPASASVSSGTQIAFTAAYSNSPAVNLQWQQIIVGVPNVTNNINTGVVNVTNNGVVNSTLTVTNLQVSNAGSYRLEAIDKTNSSNVAFSSPAALTVIPRITWYAAGTFNDSFSNDTVLTFAGALSNEVYGVDFGGSGFQTTANGYTFDDYATTGNMSIAGGGIGTYGGWMTGGATTGDAAFDFVLGYGIYGSVANTGTLNNLTIGQTYTVMVLLDDTRGSAAGGTTFHLTDGANTSPEQQYAYANGVPAVAGYIIGTFTAQATTQPLSVQNNNGAGIYNSQYNAILLEKGIAPPPPIPPTLTTDIMPLQSDVPVGAPMTFSVAVSGGTPLHYQWSNQSGLISGATNSSYSFNALPGTNSYHVGVSNAYGAIVSSTAVVTGESNSPPLVAFNNMDWVLTGNGNIIPSIVGSLLTLTDGNGSEASSAFFDVGQYVGGFVASFSYQTSGGADGTTFCLQNSPAGTNALGQPGGGLGYAGITPSAAFEINIYTGSHGGVGIRVDTNGSVGAGFANTGYSGTGPVNLASGDSIYVRLYYSQGVMQVLLVDPSVPATYTTNVSINLPATVGNGSAYIGFTGADGGVASVQTVSSFLYSYTTPPILSITPGTSGHEVVSWPVSVSSLFMLQQSGSLAGPWSPVAGPTNQVNLQNQVTLTPSGSPAFFRLQLKDPNAP
ncbi:MAG: Cell surface protein [Pedosphaera sp.]|nr:Cell surface protein [Pedosphaera sp.]